MRLGEKLGKAIDMSRSLAHGRDIFDTKIKWVVVGLALLTVVVLGGLMVYRAAFSTELNSDFITYRAAGWAVLTGSDIYKVQNPRGWPYVYPPPFAILMTPFAEMSAFTASVIWYLLSVILVVSSVQMSVTMVRSALGRFGRNPFWLYALPFAMVLLWVGQGAVEGQATILTLWLLMLALYRSQRGRDIAGGTALACAALLKVFPLALLVYFLRERRGRLVMAAITALVVGGIALPALVYGWQRNLTYWQEWIAVVAQPSLEDRAPRLQSDVTDRVFGPDNPRNQALQAVLWRLGAETQARSLTATVGLMMVLAFLALVNTDSLLRTLARVTLVVYLLASICTLALPGLQYVGLLCWTTTALWVVLLFVAARYKTDPEGLTTGKTVESQGRRHVTAGIVESIKGIGVSLGR